MGIGELNQLESHDKQLAYDEYMAKTPLLTPLQREHWQRRWASEAGQLQQRRRQLQTLRLSCKSEAYAAIRQGQLPFSLDQIRLERPAKQAEPRSAAQGTTADWVHPELAQVLTPNPTGDSHPHPVEIDLPPWILARGVALRRWLFSHGSALRIEAPEALRQEQQGQALEMLALAQRRPGS